MIGVDLTGWHDFFVIVGSSAGALTGLMFVTIALSQGITRRSPEMRRIMRSYATPTVVHFSSVLSIAAVLSMPRLSLTAMKVFVITVSGLLVAYARWIHVNSRRFHDTYKPDLEDLIWHFVLPSVTYGTMLVAVAAAWNSPDVSLYFVGSGMIAALIIGIHNAWDSAVWQVMRSSQQDDPDA